MPLQYPYQEPKAPRNWPAIILITLGILVLAAVIYLIANGTLFSGTERGDNMQNDGDGNDDSGLGVNNSASGTAPTGSSGSQFNCDADIYNCGDFGTQAEAQAVFDVCFPSVGDIHGLDNDGDGVVCEGLG